MKSRCSAVAKADGKQCLLRKQSGKKLCLKCSRAIEKNAAGGLR